MRISITDEQTDWRNFGRTRYPWDDLKVGASLIIESGKTDYHKAHRAAYRYAQKRGWKIQIAWDKRTRRGRITRLV